MKVSSKIINAALLTMLCIILSAGPENIFLAFIQVILYIQIVRLIVQRRLES